MDLVTIFAVISFSFGLPDGLLSNVCYVESKHNPKAIVMDSNGYRSVGLCQVQLRTAKWLGFKGKEKDLLDPYVNAYWAATYLSYQYNRYGNWLKTVKAYNAGSAKTNKPNSYYRKVVSANPSLKILKLDASVKTTTLFPYKEEFYEQSTVPERCSFFCSHVRPQ